jgi:hypothetical protein
MKSPMPIEMALAKSFGNDMPRFAKRKKACGEGEESGDALVTPKLSERHVGTDAETYSFSTQPSDRAGCLKRFATTQRPAAYSPVTYLGTEDTSILSFKL